jgi:hypothetical protein
MHVENMHLVWKKTFNLKGRKTHKKWPSKSGPNTIEIYIKNSHKTQPRRNNRGRPEEILDGPGQRGKKNPSRSELEGHQNKETCNHGRESQKLHAQTGPQSVDHGLKINIARPKREDLKALTQTPKKKQQPHHPLHKEPEPKRSTETPQPPRPTENPDIASSPE